MGTWLEVVISQNVGSTLVSLVLGVIGGNRGERNREEGFFPVADSDFILTPILFTPQFSLPFLPHPSVSSSTILPSLQFIMASEAEKTFQRFSVFGESSSSGTEMNNKNFSKLCKDCGVMDGKTVTSTDVDIVFSKVK